MAEDLDCQIADDWREEHEENRLEQSRQFFIPEELDSGTVVARGDDIRFWHLTFQEFLAARAIAAGSGDVRDDTPLRSRNACVPT